MFANISAHESENSSRPTFSYSMLARKSPKVTATASNKRSLAQRQAQVLRGPLPATHSTNGARSSRANRRLIKNINNRLQKGARA
jgi:hypothetical protein